MTKEEIRQETLSAEKENFPRCAGDKELPFHGVNSAYGLGFVDGALWANNSTKYLWISVKDDLPCNYPDNIHFGFTNNVIATDGTSIFILHMKKCKDNNWIWCGYTRVILFIVLFFQIL